MGSSFAIAGSKFKLWTLVETFYFLHPQETSAMLALRGHHPLPVLTCEAISFWRHEKIQLILCEIQPYDSVELLL